MPERDGEKLYLRRPDAFAERWTGKRTKESEAAEKAAAKAFGYAENFEKDFHRLAVSGNYAFLYADTYKESTEDIDTRAHRFVRDVKDAWPYLQIENGTMILRKLRTIKQPCEIEAIRKAESHHQRRNPGYDENIPPGTVRVSVQGGIRARTVAARHRRNRLSAHHFPQGQIISVFTTMPIRDRRRTGI